MSYKMEFNNIISDILKHEAFLKLKNENHHGITRLDHSINVAKLTYYFAKKSRMKNYISVTRAALLHDFFSNDQLEGEIKVLNHPAVAAENAKKYFDISDLEYSMIKTHMFPMTFSIPKNKESWLLVSSDKLVASYEMLKYKVPQYTGMYYLLLINIIFTK